MYNRNSWMMTVCAAALLALAACASQKEPATTALADAEAALADIRGEAAEYRPDELAEVENRLGELKASYDKGDYRDVVEGAPDLQSRIAALGTSTAQAKSDRQVAEENARNRWTAYSNDLPKMVESIEKRVEELGKARRLPNGLTQETLDNARARLETLKGSWSEATAAHDGGNVIGAVTSAEAAQKAATEAMLLLGMDMPQA